MTIEEALRAQQDDTYRHFSCKLIPSVDPSRILGVRTPAIRALARALYGTDEAAAFLADIPHRYYEEDNLHAFLIERIRDIDALIEAIDRFLPLIDNWATCDSLSPKAFAKHPARLRGDVARWLADPHVYTIRFGIGVLMGHYLDDAFDPADLARVAAIRSEAYYVNMMIAWYFATALAKQYEEALACIEARRLAPWTHNKAIQKAIESRRITEDQKRVLRALKVAN